MSYSTEAAKINRQPLTVVELLFDTKISSAGVERFADGNVPLGQTFEPCIDDIQYSPTKITDSGLGYRCTVSVILQDFPHPSGVGTYFGRLIGSNPFYLDRQLHVYRGFQHASFSLSNMKKGVYFIKKIDGPDERGRVKITAADILTKLDGEQALWPPQTNGNLSASITNSATGTITIGDTTNFAAGGYATIDSEIVKVTAIPSTTQITIADRGSYGTAAVAHDVSAPARRISAQDGTNVVDFIYALFVYGTKIDTTTYINLSDWNYQRDNYLQLETTYGTINEPTAVKDIIADLCKQFSLAIWWDDESQKIMLKALGRTLLPAAAINHLDHILNVGHAVTRDQSKALTQVRVHFDKIDHSGSDSQENYRATYIYKDAALEGASGYNTPLIEEIFANWIPASGTATASKIATRLVSKRKKGLWECKFRLDVRDATLVAGDEVEITTDAIQGSDGYPVPTSFMVVERNRKESHVEYTATSTGINVGERYFVIAPDGAPDYASATTEQKQQYGYICGNDELMPNGDAPYLIV